MSMACQHQVKRRGGGRVLALAVVGLCLFQLALKPLPVAQTIVAVDDSGADPSTELVEVDAEGTVEIIEETEDDALEQDVEELDQGVAEVASEDASEVIDVAVDEVDATVETVGVDVAVGKTEAEELVSQNSKAVAAGIILLAFLLAKTDSSIAAPTAVPLEKRPDYPAVVLINVVLSLAAGMLNALAFLEMAATIAHHSGNMTHWGRNWGTADSFRFCCYLAAFMLGGSTVGFCKSDCEAIFVGRYSATMLSTVVSVIGGIFINIMGGEALSTLVLWAYALGVQNGLCRKFSSMPLCSTHFTGYLTDTGNGLGTWMRSQTFGENSPNMQKTFLFIACMVAFAAGGFAAKVGLEIYGMMIAFVPAALMAGVAVAAFPLPSGAAVADKK